MSSEIEFECTVTVIICECGEPIDLESSLSCRPAKQSKIVWNGVECCGKSYTVELELTDE